MYKTGTILCLAFLMLSTSALAADKVVVIPLGGAKNSKYSYLVENSSPPVVCNSYIKGAIALTSLFTTCVCNGTAWVLTPDGTTSCVWVLPPPPPPTLVSVTGRVWMDRNLGASQVAPSFPASDAYGDLYQWGRLTDGHEKRDSAITVLNATSATDVPGHANFIIVDSNTRDWRVTPNDQLWQGIASPNNVCPAGFRLPTDIEWVAEYMAYANEANIGALFASALKLPSGEYRSFQTGTITLQTGWVPTGYYWSSTVGTAGDARYISYNDMVNLYSSSPKAMGFSVRCIQDEI